MTEKQWLENICSDTQNSNSKSCDLDEKCGQKFSVSDHVNEFQDSSTISASFVLNMECFLEEDDMKTNSRITRNFSRKLSGKGGEKKIYPTTTSNEKKTSLLTTPHTAAFHGSNITPEKPLLVAMGSTNHHFTPQIHHQITITSGGTVATKNDYVGKRFGFRRTVPSWTIMNPRRMLLFFASLSSMGTLLLIYFTLSMSKIDPDDSFLN